MKIIIESRKNKKRNLVLSEGPESRINLAALIKRFGKRIAMRKVRNFLIGKVRGVFSGKAIETAKELQFLDIGWKGPRQQSLPGMGPEFKSVRPTSAEKMRWLEEDDVVNTWFNESGVGGRAEIVFVPRGGRNGISFSEDGTIRIRPLRNGDLLIGFQGEDNIQYITVNKNDTKQLYLQMKELGYFDDVENWKDLALERFSRALSERDSTAGRYGTPVVHMVDENDDIEDALRIVHSFGGKKIQPVGKAGQEEFPELQDLSTTAQRMVKSLKKWWNSLPDQEQRLLRKYGRYNSTFFHWTVDKGRRELDIIKDQEDKYDNEIMDLSEKILELGRKIERPLSARRRRDLGRKRKRLQIKRKKVRAKKLKLDGYRRTIKEAVERPTSRPPKWLIGLAKAIRWVVGKSPIPLVIWGVYELGKFIWDAPEGATLYRWKRTLEWFGFEQEDLIEIKQFSEIAGAMEVMGITAEQRENAMKRAALAATAAKVYEKAAAADEKIVNETDPDKKAKLIEEREEAAKYAEEKLGVKIPDLAGQHKIKKKKVRTVPAVFIAYTKDMGLEYLMPLSVRESSDELEAMANAAIDYYITINPGLRKQKKKLITKWIERVKNCNCPPGYDFYPLHGTKGVEGLCKQIQDNKKPNPNRLQFSALAKKGDMEKLAPECKKPAELVEPEPVGADVGPEPEPEESWWDSDEDKNLEESMKRRTKSEIKIIIG